MADLKERVAYVHGLASGFDVAGGSKEGQVLVEVLDVLEAMAEALSEVESAQQELEAYVESLDGDLADLEEDFYGDDEGEDEDDLDGYCPSCGEPFEADGGGFEGHAGAEIACPQCGAVFDRNGQRREDLTGRTQ